MKILFLGYAVNEEEAARLSGISIAGNKMQVNLLKSLEGHDDIDIECVTVYPVAPFPNDKSIYISKKSIQISETLRSIRVGFCNLPLIKQFWQIIMVYLQAKQMVDKDTVVFTFNMFPQVGIPAKWIKKKYGCFVCSLLADLPIDDNKESKNIVRNVLRHCFEKVTCTCIKCADSIIALNPKAVDLFAPGTPFIIIEGGVNEQDVKPINQEKSNNKRIVYSGALTEYSGILTLIESMKFIEDKDIKLEIYGGGYIEDQVKLMAESMPNVFFCGKVSNDKMLDIQRNAYLLVNPRPTKDSIAQVTFPSKMFEYMISGTPVISTKLNGLSQGFLSRIFVIEDETPEGFSKTINRVCRMSQDDLKAVAESAYSFILKEKNWTIQAMKIKSFLEDQISGRML